MSLQFLRKLLRIKFCAIGIAILIAFTFMALFSDIIAPYNPYNTDLSKSLLPPSWRHPLGTDEQGRDILSRVIYGSRITLLIALLSTGFGAVIGIPLGMISSYYGGRTDFILQRLTDIMLSIPGFLLALALIAVLGTGIMNIIISVGIYFIPIYIRIARGPALQVKNMEYVLAARQLGLRDTTVMFKHILPNVAPSLIVQTTLNLGVAVLFASGLGFLGLGVPPPAPEWGTMLGTGRAYMFYDPYVTIFPGLAVFLTVLGFNLVGDGFGEILSSK